VRWLRTSANPPAQSWWTNGDLRPEALVAKSKTARSHDYSSSQHHGSFHTRLHDSTHEMCNTLTSENTSRSWCDDSTVSPPGAGPEACEYVGPILRRIVLQWGKNLMWRVYSHIYKYKTRVHKYREVGSQSGTGPRELRERQINTPSERKRQKKRLTKKDVTTSIAKGSPLQL
jgi:hypothetical protein